MARNALADGLKQAAGHQVTPSPTDNNPQPLSSRPSRPRDPKKSAPTRPTQTVLVGGHFVPEVRRTLLLVQDEHENAGKNLKQLLGEATTICARSTESRNRTKATSRRESDQRYSRIGL